MCIRGKLKMYQFLLKASVQKSMQIFFGKILPYFLLKGYLKSFEMFKSNDWNTSKYGFSLFR